MFSFVHKIVLFAAFPRAKNRALDRAFWCSPSCTKSCFLVLSFVPKIVLFGALPRAKNRALVRAFWCSPSCPKSCFLVLSFVHCSPLSKHRAIDRAFWCSPSCTKSFFLVLSFVPQIVLFGAFPRAKNRALDRAFWCSPSCQKSCSRSCWLLQLLGLCQYVYIYAIYSCKKLLWFIFGGSAGVCEIHLFGIATDCLCLLIIQISGSLVNLPIRLQVHSQAWWQDMAVLTWLPADNSKWICFSASFWPRIIQSQV